MCSLLDKITNKIKFNFLNFNKKNFIKAYNNSGQIAGNHINNTNNIYYQNPTQKIYSDKELIEQLENELDYNCTPGVGNSDCPFNLEKHQQFLDNYKFSNNDDKNELKNLIKYAKLCNGKRTPAVKPGNVKGLSKTFKAKLQSFKQI
jgi:hypothetical protein